MAVTATVKKIKDDVGSYGFKFKTVCGQRYGWINASVASIGRTYYKLTLTYLAVSVKYIRELGIR